jgi:AcrR family transcriptional regulator
MSQVNTRAYDSSGRRAAARERRDRMVQVARRRFLDDGYATTTLPMVAAEAKVSVETLYKAFGSKAGLLAAVAEAALSGPGPQPTMEISDERGAAATDPYELVATWAELAAQVIPRLAPIMLLIRGSATTSTEVARLRAQLDQDRLDRMADQARLLARHGWLREGVSVEAARDSMWAYTDPGMYELLVLRRGWSIRRFRGFLAGALMAAMLPPLPMAEPDPRSIITGGRFGRTPGRRSAGRPGRRPPSG